MNPLRNFTAGVFLGLSAISLSAQSLADVTVSGDVRNPESLAFTPGMRLLDAVTQTRPNPESYWLAAAWFNQPLLEQQTRLKAGVLFDLQLLKRGSMLNNNDALADVAARLYQDINRLPVTGRKVAVLDPVALEVGFAHNYLLSDGDQLIYPAYTDTITVVGAVQQQCTLALQAKQEVRDYLDSCPRLNQADTDYLWLIRPDGQYQRVAIAAWNRQDGVHAVAGSTILVPVRNDNADLPTPDLNEQLAQFLATQPLAKVAP
ncbi:capsule biosynthesis GfcC family protein [Pseudomonas sp. CCC3.1]|nr:capsule biosynthesis GfcC family protein [Pseudomonas sp. CCC3.1]MEB0205880.1 capsule biosynthesis GfcC family protein [Pseudomonas sp. CCC3.1]WPX34567.1 capsule biosynthesis GfcC family protein [Pseudomonas sp. CCC3.1]